MAESTSDDGAHDAALRPGDEGIDIRFNLSATATKQVQKSERESSCASVPTAPRFTSRKMVMKSVLERGDSAGMPRLCSLQNLSQDIIDIDIEALLGGMAELNSSCTVGSEIHSGALSPAA